MAGKTPMKTQSLFALAAAALLVGCSSGHFSSGVKTVSVNTTPQRGVVLLAPDKAPLFSNMANSRGPWLQGQLRAAINHQLSQSSRFQPAKGAEDGQIVFNSLRHGLIEVSANNYAAQIVADVTLLTKNGKTVGSREITATGGDLHSLIDFEDSKTYEDALIVASDKLALELVNDL